MEGINSWKKATKVWIKPPQRENQSNFLKLFELIKFISSFQFSFPS